MTEMDRIWRIYREREYGRQTPEMRERFFELDWNEAHREDREEHSDYQPA